MREFTISFVAYAGVTIPAETEEEAYDLFYCTDQWQKAAHEELALADVEITDIVEERRAQAHDR